MDQTIIQQFLKAGKEKEAELAGLLSEYGNITFTDQKTDINDHVDINWTIGIDVKGLKKDSRSDGTFNETIHWVELKNVQGKLGWLFGKANMFAFETEDYWILVEKDELVSFIRGKIEGKKEIVTSNPDFYQRYQRVGRHDVIVKVKTIDLMYISSEIIKK